MATQKKYYTVGVSNKFSAFAGAGSDASSDEDGDVILSEPPTIQEQSQPQQPVKKENNRLIPTTAGAGGSPQHQRERRDRERGAVRLSRGAPHNLGDGGSRGGLHRGSRGGAALGRPRFEGERNSLVIADSSGELQQQQPQHQQLEDGTQRRRGGGFRGRGSGAFRGRGMGTRVADVGNREFDRHSGTGRGREMKKAGAGGHNWGEDANRSDEPKETETENSPGCAADKTYEEEGAGKNGEAPEKDGVQPAEVTIDLETYKKMQAEKRANLPMFVSTSNKPITTERELEAEGFVRHVKEGTTRTNEESDDMQDPNERDDRIKRKSMNVYEYIHNEGGSFKLFPPKPRGGRGGMGSRGGRGGSSQKRSGFATDSAAHVATPTRHRDAPDLYDARAFPTLGASQ